VSPWAVFAVALAAFIAGFELCAILVWWLDGWLDTDVEVRVEDDEP